MNVLPARVEGPGQSPSELAVITEFGERWQLRAAGQPGEAISIGVRPESLQLEPGPNASDAWNALKGTVSEVAYLGAVVRYHVQVTADRRVVADIHNPDFSAICAVGDRLTLWFAGSRAILLPAEVGGD